MPSNRLSAQSVAMRMDILLNKFLEGDVDYKELQAAANATGKITAPHKDQLKYQDLRGEKPDIEFFKEDKTLAKKYLSLMPDTITLPSMGRNKKK